MALPFGDDESAGSDMDEPADDFETFAAKAWPDLAGDPERLMAAKEAIKICLESDEAGEYDSGPPPKKGGSGLALIFGAPKKKG